MYGGYPGAGAPPPPAGAYGGAPGGYGSPAPPAGYGAPAGGAYGAAPGGYGAAPGGYGAPAGGYAPSAGSPYGAPAGYGRPPAAGGYGGASYGGSYGGGGGSYGGGDGEYRKPFHQGGQHVLGKDRCPFYTKMGACRHGDRCTKVHDKPTSSCTIILPMMYPNPKVVPLYINRHGKQQQVEYDKKMLKKHIEDFYEDVFCTVMEFGRIVEMRIVDNLCEHLLGNVYIKFENEVAAQNAVDGLNGKMYNGILLLPELCPVHDFADAICKEVEDALCKRGIQCNYWHPTPYPRPDSSLLRDLARTQDKHWSRVEKRDPKRDRSPPRGGGGERERSPRGYRRERSPEGAGDSRLCHICGRTGHISKDCPMKE